MSSLAIAPILPPTAPADVAFLTEAQTAALNEQQIPLLTDHMIHAGMYARTITMPPNCRLIGALIKRATVVITVGDGLVSVGREMQRVAGYRVLPASAGRKQAFVTLEGPLIVTMMFPTSAKTVAEAEAEFTSEAELLLSRRQDFNTVVITGE